MRGRWSVFGWRSDSGGRESKFGWGSHWGLLEGPGRVWGRFGGFLEGSGGGWRSKSARSQNKSLVRLKLLPGKGRGSCFQFPDRFLYPDQLELDQGSRLSDSKPKSFGSVLMLSPLWAQHLSPFSCLGNPHFRDRRSRKEASYGLATSPP